jgi:hypothetical protein
VPGAALHFLLAGRVLARWRCAPITAPFDVTSTTCNAFLHGALGPDMGYFPGSDPLLSRLAHYARTGALCRALVREAERDVESAFAWGWVTHVLADVAVHPLVNDACGELLRGKRTPVWGEDAGPTHLRVETGLDAVCCARHPGLARIRLRPALDAGAIESIRRAFRAAYGAAPGAEALRRAHDQVTALAGPLAALQSVASAALAETRGVVGQVVRAGAGVPLRLISAFCPASSQARGLFSPVRPPAWLLEDVDMIEEGFADWFDGHYVSGLQFLRDHCLDTGEVASGDSPVARQALAEFIAVRGARAA